MTEPFQRNDSLLGTGNYPLTEKELVVLSWTIYRTFPQLRLTQFRNEVAPHSLPTGVTNERNDSRTDNANSQAVAVPSGAEELWNNSLWITSLLERTSSDQWTSRPIISCVKLRNYVWNGYLWTTPLVERTSSGQWTSRPITSCVELRNYVWDDSLWMTPSVERTCVN
jgi:hypothetical protein